MIKINFIFFKFTEYFRLIYYQILKGSIFGTIPFIFIISIIYSFTKSPFIESILGSQYLYSNFDGKIPNTADEKDKVVYGRLGLFLFFFGLFSTQFSINELIPYPNKENKENAKNKLISQQKKKYQKYKYEETLKNKNNIDESITTEFSEKNNYFIDTNDLIYLDIDNMLVMKRRIYQAVCAIFSLVNIYFITICKTQFYTNYVLLLTFIFWIIDMLIIWFLNSYVLKEMLLIAPILVSFEFVQIIGLHFLTTFNQFVIIYLGRIIIVSIFRIFIDPFIQSFQIYKKKFYNYLKRKSEINEKFEKYLIYFKNNENNDENFFHITGKKLEVKNEVSNELLLFSLVSFTTKAQINYNRPMTLLIVYFFPTLTVQINPNDYYKYISFLFIILFVHIGVDILTLYLIEFLHKFKIFDYFSYCEYRYQNRKKDKIKDSITLDVKLDNSYRSWDSFCFSQQYYFLITYMAFANLMMMFGILMMFSKNYILFRDPMSFVMFILVYIINNILIKSFIYILTHVMKFWKINIQVDNKEVKNNFNLVNYSYSNLNLENMAFAKEAFLLQNKEFILNNVKYILKKEDFRSNNEYLLKIYKQLIDKEKLDQIKEIKKIIYERKNLNNYKINKGEIKSSKEKFKKLLVILNYWKYWSKNIIYFKSVTKNLKMQVKKNECEYCKINNNLEVNELLNYNELFKIYRIKFPTKFPNETFIREFYEKYQKFETVCQNCKILNDIKKFKTSKETSSYKALIKNITNLKGRGVFINLILSEISPKMKKFIFFWHISAKSKILHDNKKFN